MQRAPGHFGLTWDRGKQLDVNEAMSFTVRAHSIGKGLMTHIVGAKRDSKRQMCVNTLERGPRFTFSRSTHTGKVTGWELVGGGGGGGLITERWEGGDVGECTSLLVHIPFPPQYSNPCIISSIQGKQFMQMTRPAIHWVFVCVCVYWRGAHY